MNLPARFGLLGDVHAHDENLAIAIESLQTLGVDRLLCVGDLVDGPGDVDRCVALLDDAGALVVRGNHDRWILSSRMRDLPDAHHLDALDARTVAMLSSLPETRRIETANGPLELCHGVGHDDMVKLQDFTEGYALDCIDELRRLRQSDLRWAVGGHTHEPMDRDFSDLRFVNPGTLLGPEATFALLDVGLESVEFYSIDGGEISLLEPGRTTGSSASS